MAADDWLPPWGFDEDDDREGEVTCRYCGDGPFTWLDTGERWVLIDEDARRHQCVCPDRSASVDDFEDLS